MFRVLQPTGEREKEHYRAAPGLYLLDPVYYILNPAGNPIFIIIKLMNTLPTTQANCCQECQRVDIQVPRLPANSHTSTRKSFHFHRSSRCVNKKRQLSSGARNVKIILEGKTKCPRYRKTPKNRFCVVLYLANGQRQGGVTSAVQPLVFVFCGEFL